MSQTVLVVGGGQAGGQAVASLRSNGFDGRIVLIGAESVLPYQRPPLSKAFLAGSLPVERLFLRPPAFYEKARVDVMLGVCVTGMDINQRQVTLDDGRELEFDRLVLATGGRPRPLSCPGADSPILHYLRTVADVEGIRAKLRPGARLVLIGGGYIGLEIAAVAAKLGLMVTVVEAEPTVLARVTCPDVAQFFEAEHRRAGVTIRCATTVTGIEQVGSAARVLTADGESFDADLVIAGIGLLPNVELASAAGLTCDNGIVVDELCETSEPGIYAAGDCTQHPSEVYGCRLRLESVHNAIEQAKTAAAAICGSAKPYRQVPWFWSDQYDLKLQTAGLNRGYDQVVLRGDPDTRSFAAFYLHDGRMLAVDAINRPIEFMAAKSLIAERAVIDGERLADERIPVQALAHR
ncbi:NAD(P)/FAD-dependent oxidoreductase [Candidatus Mycolicibacterium alkanivorans]|uniref:FAD-dependent oxidoreductase n=1 Tax=Candidatus Mycolicibacterium alkanivorans TaxID=2954114 RepID=A0ABS9YVR2_9MYCO|nr:FAD-dependent oxidoreductase [Candidatus Mycolicibacterium alkanivorans]MCI4675212.1 FAD-dependent oxidoreductase [Candidatus Mycolicibacterium alkanivorans]